MYMYTHIYGGPDTAIRKIKTVRSSSAPQLPRQLCFHQWLASLQGDLLLSWICHQILGFSVEHISCSLSKSLYFFSGKLLLGTPSL